MKVPVIILLILSASFCFGQNQPLFKITTNNKVGYINQAGKVIIPPVYFSGGDFSDGVAAVRLNGLYGYIDAKSRFVIKPQYDFATQFYKGFAIAYIGSDTIVINKRGLRALPTWCRSVNYIDEDKLAVKTQSGKVGCFDMRAKKLCIDTLFSSIGNFKNNIAVAYNRLPAKNGKPGKTQCAVINSSGKFIVPFGKYDEIKSFVDGYALVKNGEEDSPAGLTEQGVINSAGQLLFKRPYKSNSYINSDFHDGLAKVNLYKYWLPEKKKTTYTSEKAYEGYINLKGEVVFNDTNCRYVNNFSCKRAFIRDKDHNYILIDTKFRKIEKNSFTNVLNDEFKNGYALVRTADGWGVIDTNARFVVKPHFDNISEAGMAGNHFFYYDEDADYNKTYGIADIHGKIVVKSMLQNLDGKGFVNGLIAVVINEKLAYINKMGGIVWQDKGRPDKKYHQKLNIDYMNRGYFYASDKPALRTDSDDYWASPIDISKKGHPRFQKNALSFFIDTNYKKAYQKDFAGCQLYFANSTGDAVKLEVQDGRLYLKLQARNYKGEWRDIEYLPSSWCGNSYRQIKLEPGNYWEFTVPRYDGEIKTQIRAELIYIDAGDGKKDKFIYSNAINGGVNPGQFWNKRQYVPGGVMDPYYD